MYGLSYAQLGYERMYEMDLFILYKIIKAEIDKEIHIYDNDMVKLSWQTASLMNATGNYKRPVKPENLYTSLADRKQKEIENVLKKQNIQAKRDELLKTFNIKQ